MSFDKLMKYFYCSNTILYYNNLTYFSLYVQRKVAKERTPMKCLFLAQVVTVRECRIASLRLHSFSDIDSFARAFHRDPIYISMSLFTLSQDDPLRNRRSNTAFSEKEFYMVKGDGCLKFPENDTVRTEYDFSGVPFLCLLTLRGTSFTLGKQRK